MQVLLNILDWDGWRLVIAVSVAIGLVSAVYFVAKYLYDSGKDAWRHPFGKFLIKRNIALSALFMLVLFNRFYPNWRARDMVTSLLLAWFCVQTSTLSRLLRQAQRESLDRSKEMSSYDNAPETARPAATYSDGRGKVSFDAAAGIATNFVVTMVGLTVVEWLGSIDFSNMPTFLSTTAALGAGTLANYIVTKVLPRFKTNR